MKLKASLPWSQKLANRPHSEPVQSSSQLHNFSSMVYFKTIHQNLQIGLFPWTFNHNFKNIPCFLILYEEY
jgi:hypothetical protein